ncbi:helix-turn-helix transcriptional regulator [Rhizobiaceae bacterium n13]|uniref:Helix-turn-helix transcriptional regulator n=1 Tax=Ferirhizobium litorale TaxID=2927786 RepID=A0AAE3QI53_9HYPH|nr:winged helix-turn-helix domain-containing protein [Fererhizobium litorale]MDI7862746.1 helix-turn-helix transcriptional regulator [Fererhizobium litorale]MDI7924390.1 helix-turn-helix transcriptional regulator [Fererhizobium litorale]
MPPSTECMQFGAFRLFAAERLLLKDGERVPIGSRAMDILVVLVENAGSVVTKQELTAHVWSNLNVEETTLRVHVAALRKALADGRAGDRYIVNVAGRGYSFVAPVVRHAATARQTPPPLWPGALPRLAIRLIGRDGDARAIADLLADSRFVTISGPGGIGKTTLALAVANENAQLFKDGVCYVDFSLRQTTEPVADLLGLALGLMVRSIDPTPNVLEYVRSRQMLFVFDCCEHVIDAAADLAEILVQGAPGVSVLATSREPLLATGEYVYPLAPLSLPPKDAAAGATEVLTYSAAQLFCERAVAGGHRAELSDTEAGIVADICRKADGIALALELAASRVNTYGLQQIADQLDSQMKLVWQGRRTAPARHQTLGAMLDWSYALIDARERTVLCRLSVFVGLFSLAEAQAVAGDDQIEVDDVIEILSQLVLKSLVAPDPGPQEIRYRLLDTTRAYARAKLPESGVENENRRRHAECYLKRLTHGSPSGGSVVTREQLANIRAALEWAFSPTGDEKTGLQLAAYSAELFLFFGLLAESRRWAERALSVLPPELRGTSMEMTLCAALGHAMMFTAGNVLEVATALEVALALAEALDDPVHQFSLLSGLHMFHRRLGAFDELMPIVRRAEEVAQSLGEGAPLLAVKAMLGVSQHLKGNLADAMSALVAVRDAPADLQSGMSKFYGFHRDAKILIARTLWLQGFPDQAAEVAHAADCIDEQSDPVTACLGLIWGVSVFYLRGDWATAESHVTRIIRIATDHSMLPYKWFGLALRGDMAIQRGDVANGMSVLRESLGYLRAGRYDIYTPWLTCCLAEGLAQTGSVDQGLALLNEIDPEPGSRSDVYMPELLRVHGTLLARTSDAVAAERLYGMSIAMADAQGALSWRLRTMTSLSRLLVHAGRATEALSLLKETYRQFTEGFDTLDLRTAKRLIREIEIRGR